MSEADDSRREGDVSAARMETKFDDFLQRYEKNELEADAWRKDFQGRLAPIEDIFNRLKGPWKVFIWSVALIFTYPLYSLGRIIFDWLREHFR